MKRIEDLPLMVAKLGIEITALTELVKSLKDQGGITSVEDPIGSAELMKRLNISYPTLLRMRKNGELPFLKVRSQYRYNWQKIANNYSIKK